MISSSDRELIENIIQRDERALYFFYSQYKKPLLAFIMRSIKDRQDAEEVLQDSFFSFIESLRDFRGQSSLKTFLFSIAKNKTIDKLRKKQLKRLLFSHLPDFLVESMSTVVLDTSLEKKHVAEEIEKAFNRLPNDYALVLRLKYTEGYKVTEIAKKIQLSFKATESLIYRARKAFVLSYSSYERQNISKPAQKTRRSIHSAPK